VLWSVAVLVTEWRQKRPRWSGVRARRWGRGRSRNQATTAEAEMW